MNAGSTVEPSKGINVSQIALTFTSCQAQRNTHVPPLTQCKEMLCSPHASPASPSGGLLDSAPMCGVSSAKTSPELPPLPALAAVALKQQHGAPAIAQVFAGSMPPYLLSSKDIGLPRSARCILGT